jgi:hypothetical protein
LLSPGPAPELGTRSLEEEDSGLLVVPAGRSIRQTRQIQSRIWRNTGSLIADDEEELEGGAAWGRLRAWQAQWDAAAVALPGRRKACGPVDQGRRKGLEHDKRAGAEKGWGTTRSWAPRLLSPSSPLRCGQHVAHVHCATAFPCTPRGPAGAALDLVDMSMGGEAPGGFLEMLGADFIEREPPRPPARLAAASSAALPPCLLPADGASAAATRCCC